MKVYVVTEEVDYDHTYHIHVRAVFREKASAEEFVKGKRGYDVDEFELQG